MRLMFVYFIAEDAGSAQDVRHYARAARTAGHEIVLYGWPGALPSFDFSRKARSADAVIFIFEWTTGIRFGDQLDLARIVGQVPRDRRFVIDCDGAYNDTIRAGADYNHKDEAAGRRWVEVCDSLSDKIYQPTNHPLRPNVRPFLFHAYDPAWERPLDFRGKEYCFAYVGHSKFRWWPMYRVLKAVEPVRDRVGRIALVGHGWDSLPPWASWMQIEDYFYTDQDYLRKMRAEFVLPVPSEEVIDWMGKGVFSPVIYRPLFSRLRLVTCRTFETPAANTIPLFGLDAGYVTEIYGERAAELVLPDDGAAEKVADIMRRPEDYVDIVVGIRQHLAEEHSYELRLQELLRIVAN
jgi:hypothetical protein